MKDMNFNIKFCGEAYLEMKASFKQSAVRVHHMKVMMFVFLVGACHGRLTMFPHDFLPAQDGENLMTCGSHEVTYTAHSLTHLQHR